MQGAWHWRCSGFRSRSSSPPRRPSAGPWAVSPRHHSAQVQHRQLCHRRANPTDRRRRPAPRATFGTTRPDRARCRPTRVGHPHHRRSVVHRRGTAGGRGHTKEEQHSNGVAYYRCRYPTEYGLANRTEHPRNVYLREQDVLVPLDDWLNTAFAPHRLNETLRALCDAQPEIDPAVAAAERLIKACDQKLNQHRRALEAGADPELIAGWMREIQAQRAEAINRAIAPTVNTRLTEREIQSLIASLGNTPMTSSSSLGTASPHTTSGGRPADQHTSA
jgi:hypothetical protein